jgi:hypothetical protein
MNPEQIRYLLKERGKKEMPQGYTERLMQSLRERQRAEFLRQPVWRIAADRLTTLLGEHSVSTPQYALGLAALVALGVGVIALFKPNAGSPAIAKQDRLPKSDEVFRPGVETRQVSFEK